MDYPQEHIKPYGNDGKKSEQVEEMFDNIAPAYDKLNHTLSMASTAAGVGKQSSTYVLSAPGILWT